MRRRWATLGHGPAGAMPAVPALVKDAAYPAVRPPGVETRRGQQPLWAQRCGHGRPVLGGA
eukprot:8971833-Lingulodinium_polyedra.AAC.1